MIIPLHESDFLSAFWKGAPDVARLFGQDIDDRELVSISLRLLGSMQTWDNAWSRAVRERDRNTCRAIFPGCRMRSGLEAHHIVGRQHKLLRWCVLNGITVCKNCHHKFEREPRAAKQFLPRILKTDDYERLQEAAKLIYNLEI